MLMGRHGSASEFPLFQLTCLAQRGMFVKVEAALSYVRRVKVMTLVSPDVSSDTFIEMDMSVKLVAARSNLNRRHGRGIWKSEGTVVPLDARSEDQL